MSDLSDLYQQVILDHNRRPRNRGKLPTANRVAHGDNPTCGDQCNVYLRVDGDKIEMNGEEAQTASDRRTGHQFVTDALHTASGSVMDTACGKSSDDRPSIRRYSPARMCHWFPAAS